MATLYRTYRPQSFKEISGQGHITETLQKAVVKDSLTHAYLFYGPRGTGKTTTARVLAKRVNCEMAKGAEPCRKCQSCLAMEKGRQMDVIEIDAASNRGIDDIRALRETIATAPALGKYKVYIIDEVHMLTNEASTALLKTLEEPVKHAIFILATTELHKVLATILSRSQVFRFRRATSKELNDRLNWLLKQERREAADDVLKFIIERSDGCYRDAESLLGQIITAQDGRIELKPLLEHLGLPDKNLLDNFIAALVRGESAPALEAVDKIFKAGVDPEQLLKESVRTARDGAVSLAKDQVERNSSFIGEGLARSRLPVIIRALIQATQDLAYVPEPLLAIHLAILTVCSSKGKTITPVLPEKERVVIEEQTAVTGTKTENDAQPAINSSARAVSEGQINLQMIQEMWPQLIAVMKKENPVAATFLRALEAYKINKDELIIRARYGIHLNFFDTGKNRGRLEEQLRDLVGMKLRIKIVLDEGAGEAVMPDRMIADEEREISFMQNVNEVFGENEKK